MVRARYRNTEEDLKRFMCHTELIVKGKLFKALMFFGCAAAVLIVAFFTAQGVFLFCAAIFAAFGLLMTVLAISVANRNAKRLMKEAKEFASVENTYTFTEEKFTVENKVKGKIREKDVDYGGIVRADENGRFIYLYVNTALAFIVEKSKIEEGSAEELRKILRGALGKRCKCKNGGRKKDAAEKRKEE